MFQFLTKWRLKRVQKMVADKASIMSKRLKIQQDLRDEFADPPTSALKWNAFGAANPKGTVRKAARGDSEFRVELFVPSRCRLELKGDLFFTRSDGEFNHTIKSADDISYERIHNLDQYEVTWTDGYLRLIDLTRLTTSTFTRRQIDDPESLFAPVE